MSVQYRVRTTGDSVIVTVRQQSGYRESLVYGAIASVAIAGLGAPFLRVSWLTTISVCAGIFAFSVKYKTKRIELRINSLEALTSGHFEGGGYRSMRTVSMADIRWLEHREELVGNDTYDPAGLYAVLASGSSCLLPYLDALQSADVIGAICDKFPAHVERWRRESPFAEHHATLNLAQTK